MLDNDRHFALCSYLASANMLTGSFSDNLQECAVHFQQYVKSSSWSVQIMVFLPNAIQTELTFATASLRHSGASYFTPHYRASSIDSDFPNDIMTKALGLLCQCAINNPIDSIAWIPPHLLNSLKEEQWLRALEFFLENKHLNDLDFFSWKSIELIDHLGTEKHLTVMDALPYILNNRKEKSVKRACFDAHRESIEKHGLYDPAPDYIFARAIEDPNHLVKLICMECEKKERLFDGCDIRHVLDFFAYLKNYYTEKSIVQLCLSASWDILSRNIVRDTVNMYTHSYSKDFFIKQKVDFQSLHDEFVRLSTIYDYLLEPIHPPTKTVHFQHSKRAIKAQGSFDNLIFKLPESNIDLFEWAEKLNNCLYGHVNGVSSHRWIIFGIFLEDKIHYALEIVNETIIEASGISNTGINDNDMETINRWFREKYLQLGSR